MPINTKKPAMKQTVGAQYMCFADATEGKEYDGTYEADVEKTEVVKSVKVTENSETSDVYASGKIYDSDSPMSSIDIEVSVIAFPDDTIQNARRDKRNRRTYPRWWKERKTILCLWKGCKTEKRKISL